MDESSVSRRTLLLAGAGALAGAAVRPAGALAALRATAASRVRAVELGTLPAGGRVLELAAGVELLGLQWASPEQAQPQLRVRLAGGAWGPWVSAAGHGHGPDGAAPGQPAGDPLWTGGARMLELRSNRPLEGARLHLVLARPGSPAGAHDAALALARPSLDAGAGQPPIIARRTWAVGVQLPRAAPEFGAVELGFVHHTENPNGYTAAEVPAMLRAIFEFHRDVNGWNDIGYNFVIDLFGRIWEARAGGIDEPVVGAHAGGYNRYSSGIAVLGSFMEVPVSTAARAALERLLAWKLALHGVPAGGRVTVRVDPAGAVYSRFPADAAVSLPRIAGHRDADSTDCPGDVLYGELPGVRSAVGRLAGDPVDAQLTFMAATTVAAEQAPGGEMPAGSTPAQLQLTLRTLGGIAVPGAQVLLQARTVGRRGLQVAETTVAEGITDATGQCTIAATFAAGASRALLVRALYAGGGGGGAAVSRAVRVPPQPALTTPEATAPTA